MQRPSRWPYILAVVLIGCALLGLTAYSILQQKARFEERARITARNTARLLESGIGEALAKSDLSLRTLSAYLQTRTNWAHSEDPTLDELLEFMQTAQPELENLRVIDADGIARRGRGVPRDRAVSFADREYFQYARDHSDAQLVISRPVLGRLTGKWSVSLSRRINTPDGRFNGIVSAIWSAESFGKVMSGFEIGPLGRATLRYRDYSLIYRAPAPPNLKLLFGEKQVSPELAALMDANTEESTFSSTAGDGVALVSTLRRVRNLPLFVVTGIAREDYLSEWHRNSTLIVGVVAGFLLMVMLGARHMYRVAYQLADSEARWNFALEGSGQGVFDWDIPHKCAYFSPQYKRILGYANHELGPDEREWSSRVHPEDLPDLMANIDRHFSAHTTYAPSEFRMRHKDGAYRWIESRGLLIERTRHGQPKRMIGTIADVTDRREMEAKIRALNTNLERMVAERTAALRTALLRLQLATDAANLGVWTWTFDRNRLGFDARLNDWYEVPGELRDSGLLYDFWLTRVHPQDRAAIEAEAQKSIDAGTPFSSTFRIVLPSGQVRYIHSASVLEYDAAGEKIGMVGINRDITLQHTLEASLVAAKEAAEAANLTKSRFLANMSHEIRTPLNAMIGLCSVLRETTLTDPQREKLGKIQLAGQVLLAILNDILDHSKIEAGLMQIESRPMKISQIIDRAHALFFDQAAAKHVTLDFSIDPAVPQWVLGDALRLQQVLNNLLSNAIKFTSSGSIQVAVRSSARSPDAVTLNFDVHDTGIGLKPDEITRLFTPFAQADTSTTRKYGGTGLGLSIAQRLVQLMDGTIGVVSEHGKFSTFSFSIRAALPREGAALKPVQITVAPAPTEHAPRELKGVDEAIVLPAIKQLAKYLATGAASAISQSSHIAKLLADTALASRYAPVRRAVAQYDFELARESLQKLAADMGWTL